MHLIRYKGGTKGPILLVPGLGVNTRIFSLDTTKKNIVEYLAERKYDVWLQEWRASPSGTSDHWLNCLTFRTELH